MIGLGLTPPNIGGHLGPVHPAHAQARPGDDATPKLRRVASITPGFTACRLVYTVCVST